MTSILIMHTIKINDGPSFNIMNTHYSIVFDTREYGLINRMKPINLNLEYTPKSNSCSTQTKID